ncbi:hypothetical protein AGLY_012169 [Aphis glycines]|uniref:Uncharacterized protein n=1 Tax=Aphis glycines TaxID=307491 RepID=A0A6G0TBI1_APHGL|nr:hypothetical protein AGLY_012169 [Aphis glycines]
MRVSLMTQVFSKSVHVGLNVYRQRLTEELEDSEPTAMFSLYLNNLFDCLNRRYPGEGIKHGSPDIDILKEGITWIDSWEMEVSKNIILPDSFLIKEIAEGLRVTLHSTITLIEYLHSVGFDYVLTSKANQDKIEQFFGTIRQPGCQNDHPALPTFQQLHRLISTYKLLKPPKFGNCSIDDDEPVVDCTSKVKDRLDLIVERDDWDGKDLIGDNYKSPELVEIVIYYASGYLCHRLLKSTKCGVCFSSFLTNLDSSDLAVAELVNMKTQDELARITPVNPPIVNKKINPKAQIVDGGKLILDP